VGNLYGQATFYNFHYNENRSRSARGKVDNPMQNEKLPKHDDKYWKTRPFGEQTKKHLVYGSFSLPKVFRRNVPVSLFPSQTGPPSEGGFKYYLFMTKLQDDFSSTYHNYTYGA
jgi:hypothetical protein